jgi:hypothetical protein
MRLRAGKPLLHRRWERVVRPMPVLAARRANHSGHMPGRRQNEFHRTQIKLRSRVGRLPRRNMILSGRQEERRRFDFCEIDRRPCKGDAPRLREQIALIHVAQIERVHGRGGLGAAAARRLRADGQSVAVLQGGTCCFLGENYIELTPNLIHRFKCL